MDGLLTTAFWAVAGCTIVHLGFAAFGLDAVIHGAGHALGVGLGTIPVDAPMHACGMGDLFNAASGAGSTGIGSSFNPALETLDLWK
jgi:hypothetical protein